MKNLIYEARIFFKNVKSQYLLYKKKQMLGDKKISLNLKNKRISSNKNKLKTI